MAKHEVSSHNSVDDEQTDAPLLSTQRNFTSNSTGSMELVDIRPRKMDKVSEFVSAYRQPKEKITLVEISKEFVKKQTDKFSFKKLLFNNFPILKALQKYKLTEDLPNDIISGLTSGIMMIPQGMAFASLASLRPIVGLYISLFASIVYFLLGTGQQLSWGCIAILSIMMGSILDKYDSKIKASLNTIQCDGAAGLTTVLPSVMNNMTDIISTVTSTVSIDAARSNISALANTTVASIFTSEISEALTTEKRLEVAGAVTLICGIILAVLGKIGFGKLTVFMSDSMITGFTVGAAFHVGSSQLKTIFGLGYLPRYSGTFKLMRLWVGILSNIHHSNLATVIASVICILIIYLVKRFINEKYKKKLRVPVPIELIVVIIATVITAFTNLNEDFSIGIVKEVPVGVPTPRIPDLSLGADYITEGMVIIIVAFTQTLAMAKLLGLKHNYKVDPDQEMFACGVVSIVCSIFSGFIPGASVSRSVVQDDAGGRSQIASLIAAGLVLLVIMLIGPYFYYLPNCVLSAIIVVSLRSLILKLLTIPDIWRKSQVDCLIWVITCASVVILDADIGLFIGIITSVLVVLIRSQVAPVDVTGPIHSDRFEIWRSTGKYFGVEEVNNTRVIRINSALYFANAEIITNQVFKLSGANPITMKKKGVVAIPDMVKVIQVEEQNNAFSCDNGTYVDKDKTVAASEENELNLNKDVRASSTRDMHTNGTATVTIPDTYVRFNKLILDLSGASFIDLMGISALEFIISKYDSVSIKVCLSNVQEKCLDTLEKSDFMKKHSDRVFLTTEAAIAHGSDSEAVITKL